MGSISQPKGEQKHLPPSRPMNRTEQRSPNSSKTGSLTSLYLTAPHICFQAHHLLYIWSAGKVTEEKPTSWFIGWKKMWGLSENMKQVLSSAPTCNTVLTNKVEARVTSVPSQTYCVTLRSLHVTGFSV